MDDDAGRVEDAPQARRAGPLELGERALDEVAGVGAGSDLLTRARERVPRGGERERRAAQPRGAASRSSSSTEGRSRRRMSEECKAAPAARESRLPWQRPWPFSRPVTLRRRRARRLRRPLVGFAALVVAARARGRRCSPAAARSTRGEAMPGVRVLGADLAGTPEPSSGRRSARSSRAGSRSPCRSRSRARPCEIAPAKLFLLDRPATVDAAMDAGRDSWSGRARALLSPLTDGDGDRAAARRAPERRRAPRRAAEAVRAPARRRATVVMNGLSPLTRARARRARPSTSTRCSPGSRRASPRARARCRSASCRPSPRSPTRPRRPPPRRRSSSSPRPSTSPRRGDVVGTLVAGAPRRASSPSSRAAAACSSSLDGDAAGAGARPGDRAAQAARRATRSSW